jgi:5-methylcytosine-specific restriction enzyme subunit McrC
VDTKYKLLDPYAAKCGVAESDAYQMFAYARRYECSRVVLLYPQNGEEIVRRWGSEEAGPTWLEARTLNLKCDFSKKADRDGLRQALAGILTNQIII